ncbi:MULTISPECIES: SpoIIE family protein phosphatase [Streptomyces]|uniref:Anti-sigma regulatory factor (Ser/Thr protein kinase) n=1 Tax=Streptomyces demainii TaxID=588122 RepID=A0ABT9KIB5_9ACTN|nr:MULTISPECIES: SpoIIE family protein phosphatase [Streptomyces]MCO8308622.1 SpoIIE family protein phosphatase [Streptomyces sp. RKCA744]MDP9608149.1 anti-sigma regulatory factor (Ser/Thr protein kinase) [Streptomyces demainii]
MSHPFTAPTAQVRVDHHSAVHLAAETAREVARGCELPGALPDQAAVIASELATNLNKHASDGTLYVQPLPLGHGVEILAADRGPGMQDPERCLADGYTTTGTLGVGLGAVSRMATHFTLRSAEGPEPGTWVCARLAPPGERRPEWQGVGSVCLPAEGEEECGDARAIVDTDSGRTAVVLDGLGHGRLAAEAAQAALRTFHAEPDRPLPEVLARMNQALRHTRGAAVGLLRLHPDRADYCGIGNIRALALSPGGVSHRLTGQPGVVGWGMPTPRVHGFPLPRGATAVLHSDGVDARWALDPPPFVLRLPPPLLSAALAHGHRRVRDDATVLAARSPLRLP